MARFACLRAKDSLMKSVGSELHGRALIVRVPMRFTAAAVASASSLPTVSRRACLGLVVSLVLAACAAPVEHPSRIEPGLWSIRGSDAELGAFTGTLEIRQNPAGQLDVIRVISLEELVHPDGRVVDVVWTGRVESAAPDSATLRISLLRADFIPRLGDLVRTESDATPLEVVGAVDVGENRALSVTYSAAEDPGFAVTETGVLQGLPGDEPIFRSGRSVRATHREPDPISKALLFELFASYHELPAVEPFTDDPRFRRAVHFQVVERTDFDFYRANPDRLRVVNKVVDAISLAETEIRANAFRASFTDKAAFYQDGLTGEFVDATGMVLNGIGAAGRPLPDNSSALWTGVYTWTQALRFRTTGEEEALDNLRRSLRGLLILMDITRDPRTFARTLRPAGPPLTGPWRRGTGEFSHLDWMVGGNNDMSKGLLLGMIAGWEVLPENDPLRDEIRTHALDLLALCVFLEDLPPECEADDAGPDLPGVGLNLDLPRVNPPAAKLLAGITNEDERLIAAGLAGLRRPLLFAYPDLGGGPIYVFGISDWSGNHVTLTSTLVLQWLLGRTDDQELERKWIRASAIAWGILERLEHPLHAALAVAVGAFGDPARRAEALEQALWGLRSFPLPKHPHPVDLRIRSDFVMSPFPALPWRRDWETNPDRQQSIEARPMLEQVIDRYRWNAQHFQIGRSGLARRRVPGVDYLFLYWIARDGGLISPDA
jgi:hypothetical protein